MLEVQEYIDTATDFLQANPIALAAIVLFMLYLLIRKRKLFFGLVILALLLYGVFQMIKMIAGEGTTAKTRLIDQPASREDE